MEIGKNFFLILHVRLLWGDFLFLPELTFNLVFNFKIEQFWLIFLDVSRITFYAFIHTWEQTRKVIQ